MARDKRSPKSYCENFLRNECGVEPFFGHFASFYLEAGFRCSMLVSWYCGDGCVLAGPHLFHIDHLPSLVTFLNALPSNANTTSEDLTFFFALSIIFTNYVINSSQNVKRPRALLLLKGRKSLCCFRNALAFW